MRAVVVGVGDELLSGVVVNTNAATIGQMLLAAGVEVARSVCVGDDEDAIVDVLRDAARLAEVVVVTGGLGPTHDDRTREAFARLLGSRLVRDEAIVEEIRERFRSFGREMPGSNARQADIPEGATAIPNARGTAPGIRCELDGTLLYAIPGVPREARQMVGESILPQLASRTGSLNPVRTRTLRCCGMPESEIAERLSDLASAGDPVLAFLPGGGEVRLRFVTRAPDGPDRLARAESLVRERLGHVVFAVDEETLEEAVGRLLSGRGLTVAVAESCTAGLVAGRIANVAGSSGWLRGGVVSYATEVKSSVLGVDEDLLDEPVSDAVGEAMARGVRERLGADIGLAVTCSAGPDPQGGAPVGTVVLAVSDSQGDVSRVVRVPGDRTQVRDFAVTFALNMLRLHVIG
ncbi:MAG TPA: CinA family nicotinamide mononucleotide deamidase-related protein [Actinomycetota bacterium]|nr:CinA family nicotinamide mononucleotide deamidase-related protein [Actinomycetota bacterium]